MTLILSRVFDSTSTSCSLLGGNWRASNLLELDLMEGGLVAFVELRGSRVMLPGPGIPVARATLRLEGEQ